MSSNNSGLVLGNVAALYVENVRLAHITDVSISFNNELREVVGSTTVREYIYSRDAWSAQANGLCSFANGYNLDFLLSLLDNYSNITLKMPTNSAGTEYLEGIVLLESCDVKTDSGADVIRMSLSFKGNGPLTRNIVEYQVEATTPKTNADDAGCGKQYPETYYIQNTNNSYPYLQVGDTVYLDAAHTTPLTGFNNKFISLKYQAGTAYKLNASGDIIEKLAVTCTDLTQ